MASGQSSLDFIYRIVGANAVVRTNKEVAASQNAIGTSARRARAGLLGMSSALTGGFIGFAALGLAVRKIIRDYSAYTQAVSRVNTTLTSQSRNVALSSRLVTNLAEHVGRDLGYSLTEANTNMNTMLETGLGVHESMRVYRTSMELARVGNMDTSRSTQFLTDTMNMFRVEQARGNEETGHFARRMVSQLVVGANMASTSIEQLQVAFRYAGGEMSAMGYSSQETMSALAGLSSMGIRGSQAGTRLRQAIAKLINPTHQTIRMFRELGIEEEEVEQIMFTAEGARRPLAEGMERLSEIFRRLPTDAHKATMMFQMFGLRGVSAGTALAGMTEASDRISEISRAYGTADVSEGRVFDQQVQARMRSFGMQMQQFQEGLTDLAITFGEVMFAGLDTGRGLGTTFREMVAGIRIAGDLNNMTADQRRQWEALTDSQRGQAVELRQLMVDITSLIKILGAIARAALWIATNFPRATLAVIALKLAFGGIGGAAAVALPAIARLGAGTYPTAAGMAAASNSAMLLRGAGMLLAAHMMGAGMRWIGRQIIANQGLTREYEAMREGMVGTAADAAEQIPIIGSLLAMYIELGGAVVGAYEAYLGVQARRDSERNRTFGITADERMNSIMADRTRQAGGTLENAAVVRANETNREEGRAMMRSAALLYETGIRTSNQISESLQLSGMTSGVEEMTNRILNYQQRNQNMMIRESEGLRGSQGVAVASVQATTQLVQFQTAVENAAAALSAFNDSGMPASLDTLSGPAIEMSIPADAGDAIINRSGLIRATAGDVLANRASLASAITSAPGQMTGEILGGVSNRVDAPSARSGGGGGSTVVPTVVVQIDGREVARAVGNQHARHLERSGASIEPGQRRTMRETGFSERLG